MKSYFVFLGRNKLYTIINVLGLSVSLTMLILIAVYVRGELTVDDFNSKAHRVYVLGDENYYTSSFGLVPYMENRYSDIESWALVSATKSYIITDNQRWYADIMFVDGAFLDIFSLNLLSGNPDDVLAADTSALIDSEYARKLFEDSDPIGKELLLEDDYPVIITGVIDAIPNSVIPRRDLYINSYNARFFDGYNNKEYLYNSGGCVLIFLAAEGSDLQKLTPEIKNYFKEFYWPYQYKENKKVVLTPIKEFYFAKTGTRGILRQGNMGFIVILISVAIMVLLFAVANYINLTVAQTSFRAKEMATRRLLGASRREIFSRFISESILMCMMSFVAALFFAYSAQDSASDILQAPIKVISWFDTRGTAYALLFVLFLGTVSGLVPAIVISRFKPIDVMKGSLHYRNKMHFSRVFIIFQNVITVILIAGSLVMNTQINHLINAPLGYNTKDIIEIEEPWYLGDSDDMLLFADELSKIPEVKRVAFGQGTPSDRGNNLTGYYKEMNKSISFQFISGDSVYVDLFGIKVLRDNKLAVEGDWLTEQALRELEIDNTATHYRIGDKTRTIAGVIADMRLENVLKADLEPVIFTYLKKGDMPWNILIETTGDHETAYKKIAGVFKEFSGLDFNEWYIEDNISEAFAGYRRTMNIVTLFTCVAMVISMLGLLAMSTYFVQLRRIDIAIRKVFGSTRGEIIRRLLGKFLVLVAVAYAIAVPLAWWLMLEWLSRFSYRISLVSNWWIFAVAGVFIFAVATLTLLWQIVRAADSNPVKALKS